VETYDRVSVTVGFLLLGLVVFLLPDLPSRTFAFSALGSPLTVQLSKQWLRALLAAGLAVAGTHSVVSAHPRVRSGPRLLRFTAWIVPGAFGFLAPFLLSLAPNLGYWLGGLALLAVLVGSVILLEYYTADPGATDVAVANLALNLLTYVAALAAFALIYQSRARSLLSATATAAASALLGLSLLQRKARSFSRTALYAALIGLVMGQCTWALNYWRVRTLTGGVLLLLFFYVTVGLTQQHLEGSFTRRVLIEFLAVAAIGVWLLLRFGS
jgi:hypothetical protein